MSLEDVYNSFSSSERISYEDDLFNQFSNFIAFEERNAFDLDKDCNIVVEEGSLLESQSYFDEIEEHETQEMEEEESEEVVSFIQKLKQEADYFLSIGEETWMDLHSEDGISPDSGLGSPS